LRHAFGLNASITPDALAVRAGKLLLRWDDMDFEFDGDKLRSHCRCAGCRADALLGVVSPPCTKVEVLAITPLGYGLQIHFSDGHNRGIYPWRYLHELGNVV
jgi:DUF971 family protein